MNEMNERTKKIALFVLRWGIAALGIYAVVFGLQIGDHVITKGMTLRDHVLVLDANNRPVEAVLAQPGDENSPVYAIRDLKNGATRQVSHDQVVNAPDVKSIKVQLDGQTVAVELLGLRLSGDVNRNPKVRQLLIADPQKPSRGLWIEPAQAPQYSLKVPHPLVETGIITMGSRANPWLLWAAVLIFPVTVIICSLRWHALLGALDIHIPRSRAFVITMVGQFYSSFLPGSTGGDVPKAFYAAKQTPHKHAAVMSVFVDRVIGLLALIMLGGVMAGAMAIYLRLQAQQGGGPVGRMCGYVAMMCAAIICGTAAGLFCFFQPTLRRVLGLDFILAHLPMQEHIQHVIQIMSRYRQRPGLVLWAILITLPVHITVVVSAMLAGRAFQLPISSGYYFVAVPVIVLVGAIPISPQGAGVMEYFAIKLTERQGATVSQAVALTMSIRLVQILWNLTGGIFVLRGGYHVPSQQEQKEMGDDEGPTTPEPTPPEPVSPPEPAPLAPDRA